MSDPEGDASDVALRAREARHVPPADRVVIAEAHDNGNRRGRGLGRIDRQGADRDDDVHAPLHQLVRQPVQAVELPLGELPLNHEILPLNIAQLAQAQGDQVHRSPPLRELAPRQARGCRDRGAPPLAVPQAVSSAVNRLKMSVMMHPLALYPIIVSSHEPHADLLLSMDAERQR